MTRRPASGQRVPPALEGLGPFIAPIAALVILALVAMATLNFLTGDIRIPGIGGASGDGNGDGNGNGPIVRPQTPAPSDVVIVDPRTEVPGSLLYAKAGNVWIQSGTEARQLTDGGRDAMPAWSYDGEWVYFVRTREERGRWTVARQSRRFDMDVPSLMRVRADGGGEEVVLDGLVTSGDNRWFFWIREPRPSPDGTTVALITDGPNPSDSDIVLKVLDLASGSLTAVNVPQQAPFGHQNPAWRPDGLLLAVVRNGRDGALGVPQLLRFDPANGRNSAITGPGYIEPDYSPNGRYLAATKTSGIGTNVVILDASTGAELLVLSNDDRSWAPAWSPAGDSIAFLHRTGELVDLKLIQLGGTAPDWRVEAVLDLTVASDLDGGSRPSWWIPPDELPATPSPPPTPAPSPTPGTSASASPPPSTTP